MKNYSELSEEKLLKLLATGDRIAFKHIYKLYYRKIYLYALKFIKSPDLADDIAQDVFLKIWESRKNMQDIKLLNAYLFTICRNKTLNMLSRAAREDQIKDMIVYGKRSYHRDTEEKIQNNEYSQLLNQAIEKLPTQRKLIFKLCKVEGKSYEEVASMLGIGVGTINDHIVKATRTIKQFFKSYGITSFT